MEWKSEWPTEPGYYWFYGKPYRNEFRRKPELNFVKISKCGNGLLITREGAFWYKSE